MPGSDLVVVDASSLASILFNEPDSQSVLGRFDGKQLAAPSLLPYEMASVALKKIRRESWGPAVSRVALERLSRLSIRIVTMPSTEVFDLASETGTSPYDGAYILLARRLGVSLVTKDRGMARAAAAAGVRIA